MNDEILRLVASPVRRSMLGALALEPGLDATKLAADMTISRQAASKHLERLEHAGVVMSLRSGRARRYFLSPTLVDNEAPTKGTPR